MSDDPKLLEGLAPGASAVALQPVISEHAVAPPPLVLTVDEVAELLRVDRKTVYSAIARGELPGVRRLGRSVRVHRDVVLQWLAQGQGRVSRSRRTA